MGHPSPTCLAVVSCLVLSAGGLSGCAARRAPRNDFGIPRCPTAAADRLLSVDALQCRFDAAHGRWRTLSHESHYDVLVVHIEARDLRDAEEIARRFVDGEGGTFSEILVYAQPEAPTASSRIRRVRWTRDAGFEAMEFATPTTR